MRVLAAAMLAASLATPAMAVDYNVVTVGDEAVGVIEKDSIKTIGGYQRGWTTVIYMEPQQEFGIVFLSWLNEVDCKQDRMRRLQLVSRDADYEIIATTVPKDTPWRFVEPNTNNATMLKALCDPSLLTEENSFGDRPLTEIRAGFLTVREGL